MSKEIKKHQKILLLIKFLETYNRSPKRYEEFEGQKIGVFMNNIKAGHTSISPDDRFLIESKNLFSKNFRCYCVHNKILILINFFETYNRWPKEKEDFQGKKIGFFVKNIKSGNTSISKEDKLLLEEKGFKFKN